MCFAFAPGRKFSPASSLGARIARAFSYGPAVATADNPRASLFITGGLRENLDALIRGRDIELGVDVVAQLKKSDG